MGGKVVKAQENGFDTQLFLPSMSEGTTFTLERAALLRHLAYSIGLGSSFATRTLERSSDDRAVVAWLSQTEALVALGLFDWIELGFAMPFTLARASDDALAPTLSRDLVARAGDARLSAKVAILRGERFKLAARLLVSLPSGDDRRFLGSGYWSTMPALVASYQQGRVSIGAELGYRFRQQRQLPGLEFDDELQFTLGGAVQITPRWSALLETQLRAGVGGDSLRGNEVPMEVDAGLRWKALKRLSIDFGGGTGVLRGYGAPTGRAFVIARVLFEPNNCPRGLEDFDGFEDGDYCLDPDNDQDGLDDTVDQCPNDAEDRDGFADQDGCPEPDNDADGVPDLRDRCPLESEDRDGFDDLDGCPDPDNDQDGIADGKDECPMEPEDRDRFQDEDGCPEPGPKQATVTVTDTRILISERIYFDFDRDTIRPVSMPLLDQVAAVIKTLPAKRRIRVEGYTDSKGDAEYNRDLSYRRARAVVEYLAARGVPRDRLEYEGYGPLRPVAGSDTPEGAALNRRVEFTIIEPEDRRKPGKTRSSP